MKKTILFLLILAVSVSVLLYRDRVEAPEDSQKISETVVNNVPVFNAQEFSISDPESIWVIINKKNPITPNDFQPSDLVTPNVSLRLPGNETMRLRAIVAASVEKMFAAAKKDGLNLMISSAHRSFGYQETLYTDYVARDGKQSADRYSARPGYSEHQTGLALDVTSEGRDCELDICFANTTEGKWLSDNAYNYGFIIRYPDTLENITGYQFEPWHLRYVGVNLSTEMKNRKTQTLEEFFNVEGGTEYVE